MNQKNGILLVFATAIISGFSIFINKFSLAQIDSSVFTFMKNAVVAIFLFSIVALTWELKTLPSLTKQQWGKLMVIGLVGGAVPFLLFFKGLSLTSAAAGAFIHKTLFIYASVFAFFFLREKINPKIIVAAALLLVGNFLLLRLSSFTFGTGETLVLVATVMWAAENTLSKHALSQLSGNLVAFGRMFFGSLFILIFLAITGKISTLPTLSVSAVAWIMITSVLLLLFVTTYYNGLKLIKVSTATSILLLGSPITTLLSFAFLDATVALSQFVGIALIAAGTGTAIYLLEFFPQHTHSEL